VGLGIVFVEGRSIRGRFIQHDDFSHLVLPLSASLSILMVRRRASAPADNACASPREPCRPGFGSWAFILRDARNARSSG
jgi:hypothetical protein